MLRGTLPLTESKFKVYRTTAYYNVYSSLFYHSEKQEKLKALIEKRNTANRALSAAEAQLNMVQQNLNAKNKEHTSKLFALLIALQSIYSSNQ